MERIPEHIETAIISNPQASEHGRMYSMHKYWSKKPADVVAEYIRCYSDEGDVILDPFCGSGVIAGEAVRLGRRAIVIDLNPIATFMTRVMLTPVNLSRLQWAFKDIGSACQDIVSHLFTTTCSECGKEAVVDFVIRDGQDARKIGYTCKCSSQRLFKVPDQHDKDTEALAEQMDIPYWYPSDVPLPLIQKEKFHYLHELFTKRNLIVLSVLLNAIESIENRRVRDVLKLAFTASLDKSSRLKPLSKPRDNGQYTLSQGWVAVRFYAPSIWQEVNPWLAFCNAFDRVYAGKLESNTSILDISLGSTYTDMETGKANVIVLDGSAEEVMANQLPNHSVDYVLTDPPFGGAIQYLSLSTFWGAWLHLDFAYDREIVVAPKRGISVKEYSTRMSRVFKELARVSKPNRYLHLLYHDIISPHTHEALGMLNNYGIIPEKVIHQPPPKSFGVEVRKSKGGSKPLEQYGSYIIRARSAGPSTPVNSMTEDDLQKKVAEIAKRALDIRSGEASVETVLHSLYEKLDETSLASFAKQSAQKFLRQSVDDFAVCSNGYIRMRQDKHPINSRSNDIKVSVREAILDAWSILPNDSYTQEKISQLTRRRYKEQGITADDIRVLREDIKKDNVQSHRKKRFLILLKRFGSILGYTCCSDESIGVATWAKGNDLRLEFHLEARDVQVYAYRPKTNEKKSHWGSISYLSLEKQVCTWHENNPDSQYGFSQMLNPLGDMHCDAWESEIPFSTDTSNLKLKVLRNLQVCTGHYLMTLQIPTSTRLKILPGQFFHIICDPDWEKKEKYPLTLRRPFSVHGMTYENFQRHLLANSADFPQEIRGKLTRWPCQIDFLYKVVGTGTRQLTTIKPGTLLDLIGPCGNGFETETEQSAIIVGGGIGIAPLVALAERLRYLDRDVHLYLGALKREFLAPAVCRRDTRVANSFTNGASEFHDLIRKEFQEIGVEGKKVRICTEDGPEGERGLVTDILEDDFLQSQLPRDNVCVYACGPYGMLKTIAEMTRRYSVKCRVLMEERMACGVGACMSCTCKVHTDKGVASLRVCQDGPVFDAAKIEWT